MFKEHSRDSFDERELVASATECTGLVPALPVDDPEADEDMARLYAVHAPAVDREEAQIHAKKGNEGDGRDADCGGRAGDRAADRRHGAAHAHR